MSKTLPSLKVVRRRLDYDPETGFFTWTMRRRGVRSGERAGSVNRHHGYRFIMFDRRQIREHRLAWLYHYGEVPIGFIDHINGVRDDNRICNLRLATNSQNQANRPASSVNTSGFKGVSWHKTKKRWEARIAVRGRSRYLGSFDTPEAAGAAYQSAAREAFGEFAWRDVQSLDFTKPKSLYAPKEANDHA